MEEKAEERRKMEKWLWRQRNLSAKLEKKAEEGSYEEAFHRGEVTAFELTMEQLKEGEREHE